MRVRHKGLSESFCTMVVGVMVGQSLVAKDNSSLGATLPRVRTCDYSQGC